MKRTILFTLALTLLNAVLSFSVSAADDGMLILAKDGVATAKIVLADSPTRVEQTAAEELKSHLGKIVNGSKWEIIPESEADKDAAMILVGDSKLARELFPEVDFDAIPYDGIVVKTSGNKLLLAGHKMRGNLYAVYTFLEDTLGCRWWTSTESTIPHKSDIVVPELDVQYAPKLIQRNTCYRDSDAPVFSTKTKLNGANSDSPDWGGRVQFILGGHSFYKLIPPEKYFDAHPEWFSLVNGKRSYATFNGQLCLTNDEMRVELTKNALAALRKEAGPNARIISISQEDGFGPCQCDNCRAIAEAEGSESGPIIMFINKVAEDIEKDFPDIWVETYAYAYTRKPPKTLKPRDNVLIRLCSIECSFSQTLRNGEQNQSFREDIEKWSEISKQLFIWDYVTNFTQFIIPHPNYDVLADNIRFFTEKGAIGLFEQGDWYTTVGDFVRLRNFLVTHLMWNPSLDENALRDEFLYGYYGEKAAPILNEYLNLLTNRVEEIGFYLRCYHDDTTEWLDYDTLCKATELMEKAIQAAEEEFGDESPEVVRVRREKMTIDMVWLMEYHALKRYAAFNNKPFLGPEDPLEGTKAFLALSDLHENSGWGEFTWSIDPFKVFMLGRYAKTAVPEFCVDLPEGSWVEYQNFEFDSHKQNWWGKFDYAEDAAASNSYAIPLPGDFGVWSAYLKFDPTVFQIPSASGSNEDPEKYRIYAALRRGPTEKDGPVVKVGVSGLKGPGPESKTFNVDEINGSEYHWMEVGEFELIPGCSIYVSPIHPGKDAPVYVDRVVLIRE